MNIYIYQGEGASRHSAEYLRYAFLTALQKYGYKIHYIGAKTILDPNAKWDNPDNIFVLGGGSFTYVKKALGEYGLTRIQRFVENGGTYIGVCMGSYAAGQMIEFQGHQERKASLGLNFFNGLAYGSLPITPVYYDGSNQSATIATLRHMSSNITFPALYWGGNGFEIPKDDPRITPLTTLMMPDRSEKVAGLKAVLGSYGGKAIVINSHVECLRRQKIWNWVTTPAFCHSKEDTIRLQTELLQHPDGAYQMGMACLLDDAEIVPHNSFIQQVWPEYNPARHNQNQNADSLPQPLISLA